MTGPAEVEAEPGRLDRVLAERLGLPRTEVQRAIAAGRVLVDGRPRPKSHRLEGGERVSVDLDTAMVLPAEGPPVPVRWEDEHLFVVAKPTGMPTHPTAARRTGTLANRLAGMGRPLSTLSGPDRPGIVHRLDGGPSVLLVVTEN